MTTHIWDQVEEIYPKEHQKYILPVLERMEYEADGTGIDDLVFSAVDNSEVVGYIRELVSKCERLEFKLQDLENRHDPQRRY